ncbi:MAG: HEAT repeat domain-containing protein [bacterium]|nr:HEAT repeat domain-containing protein [bacterium]
MSTSMAKKLVAYHISRLKDKNADVRLKSIEELAQLADPESLPALEQVFKTDPEEQVRKAAREAGISIYTATKSTQQ